MLGLQQPINILMACHKTVMNLEYKLILHLIDKLPLLAASILNYHKMQYSHSLKEKY